MIKNKISVIKKSLDDLKDYFNSQLLAIPELQRNFVWNDKKARDLVDSIYKNFPIGSFTIWEASKKYENLLKHSKGFLPPYLSKNNKIHYVIDGQQRLTVIFSLLSSSGVQITNDKGKQFNSYNICFSIKQTEDDLNFFYLKKGPDNKNFFSIICILDKKLLKQIVKNVKSKRLKELLQKCHKRFYSYSFNFSKITSNLKDEELKDIFIRLNTKGLSLSSVDRAYAYATKMNLREYIKKIKERLGENFKDLNDTPIHETIYLIYGGNKISGKSIDNLIRKINNNKNLRSKFEKIEWKKIAKAIEDSINFFKEQGVVSSAYLPSQSMIPILANYFYFRKRNINHKENIKKIKKWFWASSISGRYSGKGYTSNIVPDSKVMVSLANGKNVKFSAFKKISLSELENALYHSSKSSLVRAFYCLLAMNNPKEFNNSKIKLDLSTPTYRYRKQNHHIFPQKIMKNLIPKSKMNSIMNICFLPQFRNAEFSALPPNEYLNKNEIDKKNLNKILNSHLIPVNVKRNSDTLKKYFYKIYNQRIVIITKKLEKLLNMKIFE